MASHIGLDTRDKAQQDANKLMDYWAKRGYEVVAYPVQVRGSKQADEEEVDTFSGWAIRTNMINGCPPAMFAAKMRAALA